jgi:Queuosine salvage protein
MFEVRETVQRVAEKRRLVRIDREAVARFAGQLSSQKLQPPSWDSNHHLRGSEEETVAYFFLLDTLNFCFWPPPGKSRWEIEYEGETFSGYYGLAVSLKRAMQSGTPVNDAKYLASLSLEKLHQILAGRGTLQLMDRRLENLRELGRVLLEEFDGRAENLVGSARGSAINLARLLAQELSSFRDVARYGGEKVFFYKRGQLFAADLHGAFAGESWGRFGDMDELTAFADYKLPQVLRQVGVLQYESSLAEKVDRLILLEPGSPEEVEIRANTVLAVELIKEELGRAGKKLKAYEIDWLLWNLGQEDQFRKKPYHRTVSIFY